MSERVARIRIELRELGVGIRRRVDVPLAATLEALHDVIQIAMGWTDSHLHEFRVGGRIYGIPDPEFDFGDRRVYRESSVRLEDLVGRGVERFLYVYDFGDCWEHDVIVEEVRKGEAEYPALVDGAGRCPPEDVGGAPGFMNFLEAILSPGHEEHPAMLEWYGGPFDPADFDERRVRSRLAVLAARRRGGLARHRRRRIAGG
ncbi:MAG: plasmid pRiA4b ORF-3 family protein [Rhodospirillales bacterium]|nr:plasmid pRiA4b ORF-3 family protein [Rhodospirillales bacterium]